MLFVSNHVSWVDIVVIGSIAPIAFVAKREVASWPLFGMLQKCSARFSSTAVAATRPATRSREIVKRLAAGTSVVLFGEGTSSDGNRVLPFRSALLGAIEDRGNGESILMQPMSITYTGQHGLPMGRQHRPLVAWYGDLDFMPHIKAFIERGAVDAAGHLRRARPADRTTDRKAMSKRLEGTVRQLLVAALRGRPIAVESAP